MAGNPIGISLWNWTPVFGGEQLDLIDKAAELGFTSVEIPADDPTVDVNRLAKKNSVLGTAEHSVRVPDLGTRSVQL